MTTELCGLVIHREAPCVIAAPCFLDRDDDFVRAQARFGERAVAWAHAFDAKL